MPKNFNVIDLFNAATDSVKTEYNNRRKVMSYSDYLALYAERPKNNTRDAAGYLLNAIDHFGSITTTHPWGEITRHKIFDQDFTGGTNKLVGQERAQDALRSALAAQVRDGRINQLILIHGPNGSAKSTMINALFNGLDYYSRIDAGELFKFRWIFPTRTTNSGRIGFGGRLNRDNLQSFAHLEDDQIDATLECEMRDHPLLLLPKNVRIELMEKALANAGADDHQIPDYLLNASLCPRCRKIADSLMRTHHGDLTKVLAHVQVEPWAMSRRYSRGLAQVGPQRSTDASQRQITADRSLSALPIELQNITMFETFGPLVDASGGILEFEDMLKRPIDSFKYLLGSIETGEATLGQSILKMNAVLMATTNDIMLEAFREHHEYPSFRDRISMIALPYLTRQKDERQIYELQLVPHIKRHIAPHAVSSAAHWAVLSRLHKPNPEAYSSEMKPIIKNLKAAQKCELYDNGIVPDNLNDEEAALLLDNLNDVRKEDSATWKYEGRYGASPRLIRQVLLAASMSRNFKCLSPFAILGEMESLCNKVREYPFLEREKESGGYHDYLGFVEHVEEKLLDNVEEEIRVASGIVEEHKHEELLTKYILHVSNAVKGEKIHDESTDTYEDPDESLMKSIEDDFEVKDSDRQVYRQNIISRIGGWAVEHPGKKMLIAAVLPGQLRKLKENYFEKHRAKVAKTAASALAILEQKESTLDKSELKDGTKLLENMINDHGYCKHCARDAIARLSARRFTAK